MRVENSLKDAIYNAILRDILALEYLPGQILNEKAMIEKYNCSKSPVREALQALCMDNVLRSIPRYGYEVVRLTMDDVREMLMFRYILESGMLQMHFDKFTEGHIARLEEIDRACSEAPDFWSHWEHNMEFHRRLVSYAGNTYVLEQLDRCLNCMRRAYAQLVLGRWGADPEIDTRHHKPLLEALKRKDLQGAVNALRADLNDFAGLDTHLLSDK